ncbi:hypothetical protein [Pseudomonas sp. GM25]|uniref:hypothetical protein n=1 Tax=Pseudomonas sp. GM25 TaxID=1144327 RepID=UPI00027047A9|nr:hypothetical protein [Pseudomonas sp. GM25]EJM24704.1 hypothetical protein PMI24_04634 [Pseudomonas sp. GM25]
MFDRNDFDQLTRQQLLFWPCHNDCPGLYYLTYPSSAFLVPCGQEYIRITRVSKSHHTNGLNVWLNAEWHERQPGGDHSFPEYVGGAQFEPISEEVFNQLVAERAVELIVPLKQPLHEPSGFIGALLMYSMKTDFIVSLFAEYEDEFVHFYWHTLA